MKKILFTLFAILSFSIINAQSDKGDFTIAPQIGLNLSNYSSSENLNNKLRVAFNAGVITEYYFNDRWSFRSGLIYDSKGTKVEFDDEDYIDKLNYLTVPIHANWHFGAKRNWFLNFGPTLGFVITAKTDIPQGEIDIKDELNSTFDIGLSVGVGYKFEVSDKAEIFIQYQSYNGFVNVFDSGDFSGFNISLFNVTSTFNIGAVFQL